MNINEFARQIETLRTKVASLKEKSKLTESASKSGQTESCTELGAALEELEIAHENLCQQNENLLTSRRAAEEERQRYQDLFEFAPDAYFVTDTAGAILEANRAAAMLLNIKQQFMAGKPLANFVPLEERKTFRLQVEQLRQQNCPVQEWEMPLCPRKRSPIIAALRVAAFSNGKQTYWRWLVRDITAQKQAEKELQKAKYELEIRVQERTAELQKSEQQYRSVVDNVKEVIFQTDAAGAWTFLNPAWEEVTGFSVQESIGTNFLDYIHPDDRQRHLEQFQPLIQGQKDFCRYDIRYLTKEGGYGWIEVLARLKIDADGEIVGTSGTLNDITYRKQAEEEIRQALIKEKELGELKSRFVTMASHEFRTPLAVILVSSDLLKRFANKLTDEKKLNQLDKIQAEVKHITQLLDEVLFYGKASSGKMELKPVSLNLEAFCRELLSEISLTDDRNHDFVFDCQGDCSKVEIDEKLLRQMLKNLLNNAVKYSPQGGKVELKLVCENGETIFQIRDEGIGIPESDRECIFEAFHRASNVGTIGGTGLGMAIIKQAVDLHGGSIACESEVGMGTTFTVRIPTRQ